MLSADRYSGTAAAAANKSNTNNNVIDPGDMPPSSLSSSGGGTSDTASLDSSSSSNGSSSSSYASQQQHQSFMVGRTQNLSNGKISAPKMLSTPTRPSSSSSSRSRQQLEKSGSLRIMKDVHDLEMTVVSPNSARRKQEGEALSIMGSNDPYDPYDDEPTVAAVGRGGITSDGNSLPSVEEARDYAAAVLLDTERVGSSRNLGNDGSGHGRGHQTLPLVDSIRRDRTTDRIVHSEVNRNGSRHVLRKQICRPGGSKCFALTCLVFLLVGISLVFVGRTNHHNTPSNNNDIIVVEETPDDVDGGGFVEEVTPRHAAIVDFLIDHDISSADNLMVTMEEQTPQYNAVMWMANIDELQYPVPDVPPVISANDALSIEDQLAYDRFVQRYVLALLFFSTRGDVWKEPLNFVSSLDECSWYHNKQFDQFIREEYIVGVSCDINLRINTIFIPENNLHGLIPTEIGQLSSLEMISFSGNHIMGSIPSTFDQLQRMLYFDVRYNELTGDVPYFIPNNWKQLEVLELSNNYFVGSIPSNLGTELTNLHTLALDDNIMTGTLDALYDATSLEYLYCDRNLFNGMLNGTTFLSKLGELRELDISSNDLSSIGTFPAMHLFNPAMHPHLRVLDMANNNLQGKILDDPTLIPSNDGLQFLSFHGNDLSGSVPKSISNLHALTHLDIQDNDFTGSIPSTLGLLHELTYLFVGYNPYTGHIDELPPFVVQLTNLRELSMAGAGIEGHLYDGWIDSLSNVRLLDLSENRIYGTIPSSLWNLPNLQWLFLDHNDLNEQIPDLSVVLTDGGSQGQHNIEVVTLHHNTNVTGNADSICETAAGGAQQITLLALDCSAALQCDTTTCCPSCCQPDEQPTCYDDEVARYMTSIEGTWEYNYTRSSHSYDPDLLLASSKHTDDPKRNQDNQYNDTIEEDIQPAEGYFQSDPKYAPSPPGGGDAGNR